MLDQAQEPVSSFVDAAMDLAQEVRGPLILHPSQQTGRVGCLHGEVMGQPGHFWRAWAEGEREKVLLAGCLPWLRLVTGREGCQHPPVTSLQLLALPSLVELRALLRRPQGAGGPLEAVSEALCSARGPSIPGGPSLNWYEVSHLKELVGREPAAALHDDGLSE